jgi:hypothetical protein
MEYSMPARIFAKLNFTPRRRAIIGLFSASALQRAERVGLALVLGWRSGSPASYLLLGGAAVYRCDNRLVFSVGFSRWGDAQARKTFFPQPVKRYFTLFPVHFW